MPSPCSLHEKHLLNCKNPHGQPQLRLSANRRHRAFTSITETQLLMQNSIGLDVTLQGLVHSPATSLVHLGSTGAQCSCNVRVRTTALGWASPIPLAMAGPYHLQGGAEVNTTHLDRITIWKDTGQLRLGHNALEKPRTSPSKI